MFALVVLYRAVASGEGGGQGGQGGQLPPPGPVEPDKSSLFAIFMAGKSEMML